MQHLPTAEGSVSVVEAKINYVYNYTDHLGNVRLSFGLDPEEQGQLKILGENHYYPYGLKHSNYNAIEYAYKENELGTYVVLEPTARSDYRYKCNGQEWQDELGLNLYDMDFRDYDPAIARWTGIDPVTHHNMSPYMAFDGNPVFWADPSGADADSITANGTAAGALWADIVSMFDENERGDSDDESVFIIKSIFNIVDGGSEGGGNPPGAGSEWFTAGMYFAPTFFGVPIRLIPGNSTAASYFGGAINMSFGYWKDFLRQGLESSIGNLLMHEFGHSLQEKYGGKVYYYSYIANASLYSFLFDSDNHRSNWTEVQASTLAYYYFGKPENFLNTYPVNANYVSQTFLNEIYDGWNRHPHR